MFYNNKNSSDRKLKVDRPPTYYILLLIQNLNFPIGKTLASEILAGDDNTKVRKLNLHKLIYFGVLSSYTEEEIGSMIDELISRRLLKFEKLKHNQYIFVLYLTDKGLHELNHPTIETKFNKVEISETDTLIFKQFGDFLVKFDDSQKKAIIENKPKILCIAGAGSGKTTVLTKKIEILSF